MAMFGAVVLILLFIYSFGGALIVSEDYANYTETSIHLSPPTLSHPFGTDTIGRDILARTIYGGQISLLIGLFAALTLIAGLYSLRGSGREETPRPMSPRRRMVTGLALGGGEGFVGALLGVGGGFIVAPVLMAMGYGAKQAAGTTAFIVTFASVSGFAAHAAEGRIDTQLAVLTVIAALAGSQLGAWFMARRAKPGWVKRLYAVLLLGVAAKLAMDILKE